MVINLNGESVDIGIQPACIEHCGFKNRDEVTRAAQKFGEIMHPMKLSDVIEFFKVKK